MIVETSRIRQHGGIRGITDWKFWAVAAAYLLAALLIAETESSAPLEIEQGLLAFMITFVIVTTICWHWKAFGDPCRRHNFICHILMGLPIFFLIVRMASRGAEKNLTLLGAISGFFKKVGQFLDIIPTAFWEMTGAPGILILFLLLCVALSMRRDLAVAFLVVLFSVAIAIAVTQDHFTGEKWFFAGLIVLGSGLYLQYSDADRRDFWEHVVGRMEDDLTLQGDLELKYRVLKRLRWQGGALTNEEYTHILAKALEREAEDSVVREAGARVLNQLVKAEGIAEMRDTRRGTELTLSRDVIAPRMDTFSRIGTVAQTFVVFVLAILWVLSPIDLIPDATPFFGVLDDVAIALFGGLAAARLSLERSTSEGFQKYLSREDR